MYSQQAGLDTVFSRIVCALAQVWSFADTVNLRSSCSHLIPIPITRPTSNFPAQLELKRGNNKEPWVE